MNNIFIYLFAIILPISMLAQEDSLRIVKLDSITVSASRIPENRLRLPISLTYLDVRKSQDSRQQLSLNEYLQDIPGLFALNAHNFAQDLRISIRGFGARSAFGIRGVKILVDGIPETTPDGQGQIDNLNLSIIKNIEIIRGPASTLYGNASGGVISINTIDSIEKNFTKAGVTFGSYDMRQYQATIGLRTHRTHYIFQGNRVSTDGYRQYSGFENYNGNIRAVHRFSESTKLNLHLNYADSPFAEDAGGLTPEELHAERRQARQRNVDFQTGEAVRQLKTGVSLHNIWDEITFNAYGFYSHRDFYGVLPFEFGGIIDLRRNYAGLGSDITLRQNFSKARNSIQVGYDVAVQADQRSRFRNLEGVRGEKTLEQKESFTTLGIYVLDHLTLGDFLLRAGVRFDSDKLKADDEFLLDGDDSGKITFNTLNPSVSFSYRLNDQNYSYASFSTSFETPVLSELSANPSTEGGFNENLEAQKARNFEIGYKSSYEKSHAELALFYVVSDNDLTPFELEDFPGRIFYRNAGSTSRKGLELLYSQDVFKGGKMSASYTFSDFKYSSFESLAGNFTGNQLPGIPKHLVTFSLDFFDSSGLMLRAQTNYVGSLYTNDDNTVKDKEYVVVNVHLGYRISAQNLTFLPFLGVNNMLNAQYNDNIRINAFGDRYYEPAPGANIFGGVRVTL